MLPPQKGSFMRSPCPWKFQLSFTHFFKYFGLINPPAPGNSNLFCEGIYIEWNFLDLHNVHDTVGA